MKPIDVMKEIFIDDEFDMNVPEDKVTDLDFIMSQSLEHRIPYELRLSSLMEDIFSVYKGDKSPSEVVEILKDKLDSMGATYLDDFDERYLLYKYDEQ